jgi:hypothetical protein
MQGCRGSAYECRQGIQWSTDDKAKVVRALYGKEFKELLHKKGILEDDASIQTERVIQDLCSHVGKTIRSCCLEMEEALDLEEEKVAVIMQK